MLALPGIYKPRSIRLEVPAFPFGQGRNLDIQHFRASPDKERHKPVALSCEKEIDGDPAIGVHSQLIFLSPHFASGRITPPPKRAPLDHSIELLGGVINGGFLVPEQIVIAKLDLRDDHKLDIGNESQAAAQGASNLEAHSVRLQRRVELLCHLERCLARELAFAHDSVLSGNALKPPALIASNKVCLPSQA